MTIGNRLQHAWNVFRNREPTQDRGPSYSRRPDRYLLSIGNERTITASIYTRIGIDVSSNRIEHVILNDDGEYEETVDSPLNNCLTMEANLDQTGRELIQDIAISMMDEGYVAVVPVETTIPPVPSGAYEILSLRVGRIIEWMPEHVRVDLYDERRGQHYDIIMPKKEIAIIQNPLYEVMNGPNSTLQRLVRTLGNLDKVDDQISSEKLDIIVQVPYSVRGERRQGMAEERRKEIETQLRGSKHGIAWIDGMEKVIQLNRPVENNLLAQVEYLTSMLYSQLGLTQGVFDGTADEKELLNYRNRTIEPILSTICNEMTRKFLTKTARTKGQRIQFFSNPFRMVTLTEIAEVADTFTRNEILSSNNIRAIIGFKPSKQPEADELRNKNLNRTDNPLSNDHQLQNGSKKEDTKNEV